MRNNCRNSPTANNGIVIDVSVYRGVPSKIKGNIAYLTTLVGVRVIKFSTVI